MTRQQLKHTEYNAYYVNYINLVNSDLSLIDALLLGKEKSVHFYNSIPEEKWTYSYASGKWSILEVLQHVIDTERIFSYRALCVARGDKTPLAGFEQDDYVLPSKANLRTMQSLLEEYSCVRDSSILLFKNLSPEALEEVGTASNSPLSAQAAGFVICGHDIHHANFTKLNYL